MITIKTLYFLYVDYLERSVQKLLESNEQILETRNNIQKLLDSNRSYIDKYLGVTYTSILKYSSKKAIAKLEIPLSPIYDNGKQVNFKAIKLYITKYIECNRQLSTNNNKINNLKKRIIDYKLYSIIIKKFNAKAIDAIVYKNWVMNFYKGVGRIFIRQTENHKKRIDWGKSTKNKNAIIARGGIPYLTADAENNPNYKGEKWIEYRPPIDFFIHWSVPKEYGNRLQIILDYTFKPARGVNSFVSKLGAVKKDRDRAFKLYTRTS